MFSTVEIDETRKQLQKIANDQREAIQTMLLARNKIVALKEQNRKMLAALRYQQMADYDPTTSERKGYFEEAARLRKEIIEEAERNPL